MQAFLIGTGAVTLIAIGFVAVIGVVSAISDALTYGSRREALERRVARLEAHNTAARGKGDE